MRIAKFSIIVSITILMLVSCRQENARSFYYWKSTYNLSELEKSYIEELGVSKIYLKFFDVHRDPTSSTATPIAKIQLNHPIDPSLEIIPVVYIVNKTLLNVRHEDIDELAYRIVREVDLIASRNGIAFNELQVDCDWTKSTRENFFRLLEIISKETGNRRLKLSATIRLHQIKYKTITGVPPVNRGMLMYYNMGQISADSLTNSIFDSAIASKYVDFIKEYPLPLDIVLPAFTWGVQSRNREVVSLINGTGLADFESNTSFHRLDSINFLASRSFFFRGYYFMEGDVVKVETVTPKLLKTAALQLKSYIPAKKRSVALFHLDSLIFTKYEKKDFEEVYSLFD